MFRFKQDTKNIENLNDMLKIRVAKSEIKT